MEKRSKELLQRIKAQKSEMKSYYLNNYPSDKCTMDGIINPVQYITADERILWIMKDTNGMEDNDMKYYIGTKEENGSLWGATTFQKLIYTSYGILNKKRYHDIPYYYDNSKVLADTRKIAFINIKKKSGIEKSNSNELKTAYEKDRAIILKQIEIFKPTVIIGGMTFDYFQNDLKIDEENYIFDIVEPNFLGIWSNKDRIVFNAYHPNARVSEENYCNSIIENYMNWRDKYPIKTEM